MSIIFLLIPVSIVIAACFLAAFIWAVRSGQYEDTCTPAMRLLLEEQGHTPISCTAVPEARVPSASPRSAERAGTGSNLNSKNNSEVNPAQS